MSKRIEQSREIYLAPGILGRYEKSTPIVIDERNNFAELDPRDIETKIKIYEREVTEWFLSPASDLLKQDSFKNSFVVLMICMSYIEGVEQYKTGIDSNKKSKKCFISSVNRLFPDKFSDKNLEVLYSKSRCGLFHNGMVKGGVVFSSAYKNAIEFINNGEIININPELLLRRITDDFDSYIAELRSNISETDNDRIKAVKENFNRMFDVL
ncbi:MAG: hypothetical protein KBT63_09025 [Porticoccaceae bacterium]|nr:hypothetical protein [Porticoccaceae bacterium]